MSVKQPKFLKATDRIHKSRPVEFDIHNDAAVIVVATGLCLKAFDFRLSGIAVAALTRLLSTKANNGTAEEKLCPNLLTCWRSHKFIRYKNCHSNFADSDCTHAEIRIYLEQSY